MNCVRTPKYMYAYIYLYICITYICVHGLKPEAAFLKITLIKYKTKVSDILHGLLKRTYREDCLEEKATECCKSNEFPTYIPSHTNIKVR